MASANVGRLVYDIVAEVGGFNAAIGVASKRIGDLQKIFLNSRTDVERFGMEMQALERIGQVNTQWMDVAGRTAKRMSREDAAATQVILRQVEALRTRAREIQQNAMSRQLDNRRGITASTFEEIQKTRKLADELEKQAKAGEKARLSAEQQAIALEKNAAAAKQAAIAQEALEASRSRARKYAVSASARKEAEELSRVNAFLAKQKTETQQLVAMLTSLRNQYSAGNITQKQYQLGVQAVTDRMRELKRELHESSDEYKRQQAVIARNQDQRQRLQQLTNRLVTAEERLRADIHFVNKMYAKGALDAHTYATSLDRLNAQLRELSANSKKAAVAGTPAENMLKGMATQAVGLAKHLAYITLLYKSFRFAVDSVKIANDIEMAQLQFEVFLNSAQQSQRLVRDLRRVAAETPLTLSVSTQSVKTMLQYGVAQEDVIKRLRQLGDISGADTEQMQRLSLAFGQITAAGKLQGQELRQLVEAGFNPLAEISRVTGESMFDLKVRMADGAISSYEIGKALDAATSNGGRFADMLERVAGETTRGNLMLLRGEIEQLQIELGKYASYAVPTMQFITELLRANRLATEFTKSNANWMRDAARAAVGLEAVYDPLAALQMFRNAMEEFGGGWDVVSTVLNPALDEQTRLTRKLREDLETAAAARYSELQTELALLSISREQYEMDKMIAELEKVGLDAESRRLENLFEQVKAKEAFLERMKEEGEIARKNEADMQRRRDAIIARHEDPVVGLERNLADLFKMERMGMFANAPGVVNAERDRITKEFIDAKILEITESQREAATAANAGSKEEFDLLRQISMANSDQLDAKEEARHKARQEVLEAIRNALDSLPADLNEFFPVPVGF